MGICFVHTTKGPLFSLTSLLLFLVLTASSFEISAQIQKEFSTQFNEMITGGFTMIANNVLSRTPTEDYNSESDNHSFINNIYVDIDNDDSTFNSSSANFINLQPQVTCLTIKKAYVYWAAADKENEDGDDIQPDWNFNDVKLMVFVETNYEILTADDVLYRGRDFHFSNDPYVFFKDITRLVASLDTPYGTYQVANVEAKTGFLFQHSEGNTCTSGGWQIMYIYESPELVSKNVSIFDDYTHIIRGFNNYDIDFLGFRTVPTGSVNVNMLIGWLEGDRSLFRDRFLIQNIADDYVDIIAPLRASNNFFNSRITSDNENFTDRSPASLNTLGFDAAVFKLDNTNNSIIANNQSSATIRLGSNQETYSLFLIGLSVEVWVPRLYSLELSSNTIENKTNSNDTILFDLNFLNTENDNALNVILIETILSNLEFVFADDLPEGVIYSYNQDTKHLQFFIKNGFADIGDPALNIQFEMKVKDACYFLENTCVLDFNLQFTATCNGKENPNLFTTYSSNEFDDCQLGNPLSISIKQPIVAWEAPVGSLDRILSRDNPNSLLDAQFLFPVPDQCNFELAKISGDYIQNSDCDYTGTYTNTWNFTNACGRTIEDYTQVITVPSNKTFDGSEIVVTPNQDQWNKYFMVNQIKDYGFSIKLRLFNRLGALIYKSDNYKIIGMERPIKMPLKHQIIQLLKPIFIT